MRISSEPLSRLMDCTIRIEKSDDGRICEIEFICNPLWGFTINAALISIIFQLAWGN